MAALSDVRFQTLRALGYSGSISDMLLAWLQSGPFGVPVPPTENLYANPVYAGGGLNTPPQGHSVPFATTQYDFVGPLFRSNPNGETGRSPLQYALQTNNPGLVVGHVYLFTVLVNNLSPTDYVAALSVTGAANITILEAQAVAPGSTNGTLGFIRFSVDTPGYTLNIRYGNGTTTDSAFQIEATEPSLIDETEAAALRPRTIPDAWKAALPPPTPPTPYHRNDWWYAYLGNLGYEGSLNDRELAYWLALFQSVTGGAYSAAYSTGYS